MRGPAELKREALEIFREGLAAVDPHTAMRRHLSRRGDKLVVTSTTGREIAYHLGAEDRAYENGDRDELGEKRFKRVLIVGAGKASARMSQAVEEILDGFKWIGRGLVVVKTGHTAPAKRVEIVEASHPIPDCKGQDAARRIVELAERADEETLVLVLISGGGSALLPLPADGVTLEEKQRVTELLLSAGADIGEMNALRKHLSAIKGGLLARHAHPATVITFVLSDVVGDALDVIASGPTVPDTSTFGDALEILERRGILTAIPTSIRERFERGRDGEIAETPKEGESAFHRSQTVLVGTNRAALSACYEAAERAGWQPLLLSSVIEGETREVARMHAAIAKEIVRSGAPLASPACVISGGETTVTIRGKGKGGRNQEFALAASLEIVGLEGVAILSAGTDGTDGPTDATGAIAFSDTVERGVAAGLDARKHLDENDAYPFFDSLDDLIMTGPTNTNVMDVHLVLVDRRAS